MEICLLSLVTFLFYIVLFTNNVIVRHISNGMRILGIYRFNIIDKYSNLIYEVLARVVVASFIHKRNVLELLVRQNRSDFTDDVKLFLGDVMGLDNTSEHLDMHVIMKMDLRAWIARYRLTLQKLEFKLRYPRFQRENLFVMLNRAARRSMTLLKVLIPSRLIAQFTIKYIHNKGGIFNNAEQGEQNHLHPQASI